MVLVAADLPGTNFLDQGPLVGNPPIQALTRQNAELGFRQIEPTAVLGSVVPLEPLSSLRFRTIDWLPPLQR
jgi:hypothetical protein